MKLVLKNIKSEYFKIISLKESEPLQNILGKLTLFKEPIDAYIFAINEKINTNQLEKLKFNLKSINVKNINIYSNNRETIIAGNSLKIDSKFANQKELKYILSLKISTNQEDILHKGTLRSGDRISSNGDLIVIGDVNPGAIVSAKRNVYVWGKLLGVAHAGEGGDKNAFIASLYLNPLQLRINKIVAIGPKDKRKDFYPEIAILEKQAIIIKPFIMNSSK